MTKRLDVERIGTQLVEMVSSRQGATKKAICDSCESIRRSMVGRTMPYVRVETGVMSKVEPSWTEYYRLVTSEVVPARREELYCR